MQKEDKRVIYYSDELNDDFAGTDIKQVELPESFEYINDNFFFKVGKTLFNIVVFPVIFLMTKIIYHQKFVNKRALKRVKKSGYFVYGNHTNGMLDAYVPSLLTCPKKSYIIVNPDATSIKGIRNIVMMLGALPLPNGISLTEKFIGAIRQRIKEKQVIMIYPEAHIWPYYTDIRNFKADSFTYPVDTNKPVFCFTNIYKKRIIGKRPKVVTYVDGPFYPDPTISRKENMENLRNQVYNAMKKRVKQNPKYEYKFIYKKKEN